MYPSVHSGANGVFLRGNFSSFCDEKERSSVFAPITLARKRSRWHASRATILLHRAHLPSPRQQKARKRAKPRDPKARLLPKDQTKQRLRQRQSRQPTLRQRRWLSGTTSLRLFCASGFTTLWPPNPLPPPQNRELLPPSRHLCANKAPLLPPCRPPCAMLAWLFPHQPTLPLRQARNKLRSDKAQSRLLPHRPTPSSLTSKAPQQRAPLPPLKPRLL